MSKIEKLNFWTKNGPWRSKIDFGKKKSKIHIFHQNWQKMVPRDLKSIFGRKIKKSIFRLKMDPGGQKSIFGQKIESSIFRPKLAQKWFLQISNRFLVEKWEIQISTKNWPWRSKIDFWSKSRKCYFSIKIRQRMVPKGLKSIFGWKMAKLNFRPKIDPGGQKSIIGQKNRKCYFQPKFAKKWSLKISNRFLVEKWQNQFSDQKWTLTDPPSNPKWKKIL